MDLQFSDKVERWPLKRLIPHARNARTHSEEQVAQIAGSIAEFGFVNPVLVGDDGVIVAGHGRVMAARKLGLSEAPVIVLSHLTLTQRRALMIADNQIAINAGWNGEMLAAELASLKEEAFDLDLLGFDDAEIDRLLAGTDDEAADLDEAPEPPADPTSRPGDLWICGEHRLLCGDATVLADAEKVLNGELADMAFTDPPYNVNYANTVKDKLRGKNRPILNDALGEDFGALLYDACVNILTLTKGAVYICMSSSELDRLQKAFREAGGKWSTFVIWAKNTFTLGRSDYQRQYEPILYGWKDGTDHYWCGARDQGDVWFFDKPHKNSGHSKWSASIRADLVSTHNLKVIAGGSARRIIRCPSTKQGPMADDFASLASIRGLSEADAQARVKAEGYNELPRPDRRTPLRIVLEVLREPMLALLLGGGVVYLALGEPRDALILLAFATMSVVITVVQETRTERVLEALRDLTSPRALVIRDGRPKRIPGRDVVRGDAVVLAEGDRVPADAALLQSHDLQTDESLLTGESVPVRKIVSSGAGSSKPPRPGGDDLPFVFSGSLVVRGTGLAEVTATGVRSEIGKIGRSLSRLEAEPPRLQAQTRRLVRLFAIVGGAVSVLAVLLYGTMRGGWLDAVLAGIALGMSMLPEEFPVVLTVFMAMGAWRISRARVLTRRAAAIETLGSATVLCTDKTGTLTENRMSIAELRNRSGASFQPSGASNAGMPEEFHDLVEFGMLASAQDPFDPMEKAFHELGRKHPGGTEHLHGTGWTLAHAYGLRPDLLAMTHVWKTGDGRQNVAVAAKGAPEAIAELCHLGVADFDVVKQSADAMAAMGLRVLGIARASFVGQDWPKSQHDFDFEFLGLVGLADPLREKVPDAVAQCRSAGIKVVMITGDYPATAEAIARQAGIDAEQILTGEQLDHLDDSDLAIRVRSATLFARIMPEQKLRIVTAFKSAGEIVAMTGDGVNDAPSLKAAHIGIAMGGRGTDVAREASSIVLLDDDFGSIVKAVQLGRRIYDNLRKAMGFIFAVHVTIAGLALLPLGFGLPVLFGPMHIAFLEMVIDPVCSLVFEAETDEDDVMRRPPRAPDEPLFSWSLIGWSLLQGAFAFGMVAVIFVVALHRGMPEDEVRALTFFSLVLAIVSLIFVNRSFSASLITALRRPNRALVWVLLAVTAILALTLLWPFASNLFRFGPLHVDDLALTLGAGILVLIVPEALKPLWRRRLQPLSN